MINIKTYRLYWLSVKERITSIKHVVLVRTEAELKLKIKDFANEELFLVIVVPSSDTVSPDHDNIREKETAIVYAMKKIDQVNQTEESAVDDMEETQQLITFIKEMMLADSEDHEFEYHQLLKQIDFSRMHTDPEYDYLGSEGYSISFVLTTNGF